MGYCKNCKRFLAATCLRCPDCNTFNPDYNAKPKMSARSFHWIFLLCVYIFFSCLISVVFSLCFSEPILCSLLHFSFENSVAGIGIILFSIIAVYLADKYRKIPKAFIARYNLYEWLIYLVFWAFITCIGQYVTQDKFIFLPYPAGYYWNSLLDISDWGYSVYEVKKENGKIYCILFHHEGKVYAQFDLGEVERERTNYVKRCIEKALGWCTFSKEVTEGWESFQYRELRILTGWPDDKRIENFNEWWAQNKETFQAPEYIGSKLQALYNEEVRKEDCAMSYSMIYPRNYSSFRYGSKIVENIESIRDFRSNVLYHLYFVLLLFMIIRGRTWLAEKKRYRRLFLICYIWLSLPFFLFWPNSLRMFDPFLNVYASLYAALTSPIQILGYFLFCHGRHANLEMVPIFMLLLAFIPYLVGKAIDE